MVPVSATGPFTSSITGLTPGTLYHVRAYATNTAGTSYGGDVSFTTAAFVPTISGNAGIGGATLTYQGGSTLADAVTGAYSIVVPLGWDGTVTPSMPGYSFDPPSRSYSNVQLDQTGQNYTATPIPLQVSDWYPSDGGQACRRPQVGTEMGFAEQVPTNETGGPLTEALTLDTSTIVLRLDGIDVTGDAVVTMLRSEPALYSVMYIPTADLALGAHSASLAYPSAIGPRTQIWNFTVGNIACGTFYTEPDTSIESVP